LGIGAKQIPVLFSTQKRISELKGCTSIGGEDLSINPLATLGYPEPLKIADVKNVIAKVDLKRVIDNGPKVSYMAQLGMLERDGMMKAMSDCNQLAVHAVFECFSGGGGDLASPQAAELLLKKWRAEDGLENFKTDLTVANTKRFTAYSAFVFLLYIVIDLIIESGLQGWPNGWFN